MRLRLRPRGGARGPSLNGEHALHRCNCRPDEKGASLTLAEIEPGRSVEVCCLDGDGPLARRLAELGFIPGTVVEVLRRAPLADPIEFQIRGYLVSLRREEAGRIRIRAGLRDASAIAQGEVVAALAEP